MPTLARGDEGRVLRFIAEAESYGGDHPFGGDLLTHLGRLVPADWIGYDESITSCSDAPDTHTQRPCDEDVYGDFDWSSDAFVNAEDPVWRQFYSGRFGAIKISDFLSRREFRRTRLFDLFAQWDLQDSLSLRLPVGPRKWTKRFSFDRFGRNFAARDRAVLEVLSPHFVRMYRASENRRRLRDALAVYEAADAAVVLLEPDGRIAFESSAARELLQRYLGRNGAVLPEPVSSWVRERRAADGEPLRIEAGERRLEIELVDSALLLHERRAMPRLTAREREILELVAEGKTNAEIAERLWISRGTVRKHLDNLYAKLGVHTRTAAAAFVCR
ncbi:MAG TPA: helix-turn-helix transcriptional regulator [Gaiellaceae bacterium]